MWAVCSSANEDTKKPTLNMKAIRTLAYEDVRQTCARPPYSIPRWMSPPRGLSSPLWTHSRTSLDDVDDATMRMRWCCGGGGVIRFGVCALITSLIGARAAAWNGERPAGRGRGVKMYRELY